MLRLVLLTIALAAVPLAAVPPAAAKERQAAKKCDSNEGKKRRNSAIGGMLGGFASRALGSAGVPGSVAGFGLPTNELLSEAISAMLDCKEQQQAAAATNDALRGGVGSTASWQSESRSNVSGSSSVTGQNRLADGSQCMTVTDVVIVDGEETVVPKRMCRAPGASGYRRV